MLGHHWHASETPFKWRFAGRPMMARLKGNLNPPPPSSTQKKNGPPLTKLSGSTHNLSAGDSDRKCVISIKRL